MKKADIIIPHKNRHDHLKNLLDCLNPDLYNIYVIAGGTFAQNCNKGARLAETSTLVFINDDVVIKPKTLEALVNAPEDFVSCTEFIPQEGKYFYGIGFDKNGKGMKATNKADMVFPCGYLFKITKEAWSKLGGFDEAFKNGGEDGDLGLRAKKEGISIGWVDEPVTHYHSQSIGRMAHAIQNRDYAAQKWKGEELQPLKQNRKKALVATNHLDRLGGSETFTRTLVHALRERMDVEVYATKTSDVVLTGVNTDLKKVKRKYDFLFINHNNVLDKLKNIQGFKIFTSHGVFPNLEQPYKGADRYVAISEEVRDNVVAKGFDCTIIRNGIDTERYKPTRGLNKQPMKVLCLCHGEKAREMVKEATHRLKMQFMAFDRTEAAIEAKMNEADIVVSLGRGALEGMSCGRMVFVFDSRDYAGGKPWGDGVVNEHNWELLATHNFSGRARKLEYTVDDVVNNLKLYDPRMGQTNRQIIIQNFNIHTQVEKYLQL